MTSFTQMSVTRDINDSSRRTLLEQRQKPKRQQKVAQVIGLKLHLKTIVRLLVRTNYSCNHHY
jgi:hypothetical protein